MKEKLSKRRERVQSVYYGSIQVAKTGGDYFKEDLTLLSVDNKYYVCLHEANAMPSGTNIFYKDESDYWDIKEVSLEVFVTIRDSIDKYERLKNKGYHLNPYTVLIVVCMEAGLDLIEEGILDK